VGGRRGSRRRRRSRGARTDAQASEVSTSEPSETSEATERGAAAAEPASDEPATGSKGGGRFGRAGLALALLLGTLMERFAATVLSPDALTVFHLAIAVGIAFLVARWYRGFMRRALNRARERRARARREASDER
jgi:hypothetical protein